MPSREAIEVCAGLKLYLEVCSQEKGYSQEDVAAGLRLLVEEYKDIESFKDDEGNPVPKKQHKTWGRGKKTKAWEGTRKDLKKAFQRIGITTCEARLPGCWRGTALSFGHLDKRRFLSDEDLKVVCLLCQPCHNVYERMPRAEMRAKLQAIIDSREVPAGSLK